MKLRDAHVPTKHVLFIVFTIIQRFQVGAIVNELITHKITYLEITFQYFQQDEHFILAEIFSYVRKRKLVQNLFYSQNVMG